MMMDGQDRGDDRVLVVGIGDGGPISLPATVVDRINTAEVLVGGRRHLDLFPTVDAERLTITGDLDSVLAQIRASASQRRVVVLASGDPCFFGIGPLLVEALGQDRVEILPGASSVALAFARLGVAWHDARVVSAHGRPLSDAIKQAAGADKLAVLTDDEHTPSVVGSALLEAGAHDAPAWVFEHLGGPREASTATTLAGLAGKSFAALNVLVVPSVIWDRPRHPAILFGLPEETYVHASGMITKPEVRAVSLSKLRLRPGGVLWDVGAASGSLGIEAASLVPGLSVYAVEKSEIQLRLLWRNVATRTGDNRVHAVKGEAPDVLADLPDPDAVFVGGSGGKLADILTTTSSRLRPDGRIVCNLVTIENLAEALNWAAVRGIQAEVVQVSIARGTDIMGMTRLQAENPVTVVTLTP
ncbi:MAG: precorrin-6y C5,15-methyltransferase (decarboxylating) subunit CbiE [Chloroflexota bacterium]